VPPQTNGNHWEEGTASVELIATVPFLLLAVLVAAQLALAGHSLWSAAVASRAGARAALVGGDARAAARAALPPSLRESAKVDVSGPVAVRVRVPRLLPLLPSLTVDAESTLEPRSDTASALESSGG
jgi:hypothetical protein